MDAKYRETDLFRQQAAKSPLPETVLPFDRIDRVHSASEIALERIALDTELVRALRNRCETLGENPELLLVAAFQLQLARYRRGHEVLHAASRRLLARALDRVDDGFDCAVVVRATHTAPSGLGRLLRSTSSSLREACSMDSAAEAMRCIVSPEPGTGGGSELKAGIFLANARENCDHAILDELTRLGVKLALGVSLEGETPHVDLRYDASGFSAETARRMGLHFVCLLESLLGSQQGPLEPELLPDAERALLHAWNQTQRGFSTDRLAHELFEARVDSSPDAVAIASPDRTLSYAELDREANRLANALRALGIGPTSLVAICLERSPRIAVALLGVLKSGAAYVPIEPDYPAERIGFMLRDTRARVVVTESHLVEKLSSLEHEPILLDEPDERLAQAPSHRPPPLATPDDLAYVIFTSGSTGAPKGVAVRHRSLLNVLDWVNRTFSIGPSDRVLCVTPMCFDLSVYDVFGLLAAGGSIEFATRADLLEPERLVRKLENGTITFWNSAPAMLLQLVPFFGQASSRSRLRLVFLSGDYIPVRLPDQVRSAFPGACVVSLGGATEATIWSNYYEVGEVDPRWPTIPYGKPIQNARYYVLDAQLRLLPIGIPGELYIGDLCLADGYWNRPDLTDERFIRDPFCTRGGKLYRTGDLARYMPDGNLEFLGRVDHQIKIRGFRIELGEIEAVLAQIPSVRAAIVLARCLGQAEKALVAYVAMDATDFDPVALRKELERKLPAYMVPSHIVRLDQLPVTANGKVDRAALPEPVLRRAPFEAPEGAQEMALAFLWSRLLGVQNVGRRDDFFALGGHSLSAVQLVARLRAEFGFGVSLAKVFEKPVLAQLALELRETSRSSTLTPRSDAMRKRFPMSTTQERLWFMDRVGHASGLYNVCAALDIRGSLDVPALRRALGQLGRRHEILRTVFVSEDGEPVQVVRDDLAPTLCIHDLRGLRSEEERAARLDEITLAEADGAFDLARGPCARVALVTLADDAHCLLLTQHHILTDEWSQNLLLEELRTLYASEVSGRSEPLPELSLHYADYSVWQKSWLASGECDAQLEQLREYLAECVAVLDLPTDRPRPKTPSHRGRTLQVELSPALADALDTFVKSTGTTPFMTFFASLAAVLSRFTGQEDIVIGTPAAARHDVALEHMLGFFANTLLVRVNTGGDPTFAELVGRVRGQLLTALAHDKVPFDRVVGLLADARNDGVVMVPQVVLVLRDKSLRCFEVEGATWNERVVFGRTAKFDLTIFVFPKESGADLVFEYATDLFDAETVQAFAEAWVDLLEAALAAPARRARELPLLSPGRRHELLARHNRTGRAYPREASVPELFEAQAALHPEAIAVCYRGERLTYAELEARSNRLAHRLLDEGSCAGRQVAICLERSADFVIAALAVLKAGAAFVPIDASYPPDRIRFMLEDSGAKLVVTTSELAARLPVGAAPQLLLDVEAQALARRPATRVDVRVRAEDLAYVMYTSGSTGRPKGVCVPHRAIVRLVKAQDFFDASTRSVFLLLAPTCFDASTFELWAPLLNGARLVVYPSSELSLDELGAVIRQEGVTVLWLTAGLFHAVVDERIDILAPLCQLIAGGDVLSVPHVQRVRRELPTLRLTNGYGPTEGTTFSTCHDVTDLNELPEPMATPTQPIPIGRPIANTRVYVLDEHGQPVPRGFRGELHVGGDGLALGYHGLPELTRQKFVVHALPEEPGPVLYRTGDLARLRSDGTLDFLGRIDRQIKLRGFRVELAEVESVLTQRDGVTDCAVVVDETSRGDKRLLAYYVGNATPEALRSQLADLLPQYMVPAQLVCLAALPLDPNGKVDRKRLPKLSGASTSEPVYRAAQDPIEKTLVELWEQLLGRSAISIEDDFFDLGGQSLAAVRLFAQIKERFGRELPMSVLFSAPTIEKLAKVLRNEVSYERKHHLVPLQPRGSRPPVFFLPGIGGHPFTFRELSHLLGSERPGYGIQLVGVDGTEPPLDRIEAMARRFVSDIRHSFPQGPYWLAGYSSGGLIAFEMARQLRALGERIGALVLMDCPAPGYPAPLPLRERLLIHLQNFRKLPLRDKLTYLRERIMQRTDRILRRFGIYRSSNRKAPDNPHLRRVNRAMRAAINHYRPGLLDADLFVLRADKPPDWPAARFDDPEMGWRAYVRGEVSSRPVPGSHLEIFRKGNVEVLGRELRTHFEQLDRPIVACHESDGTVTPLPARLTEPRPKASPRLPVFAPHPVRETAGPSSATKP